MTKTNNKFDLNDEKQGFLQRWSRRKLHSNDSNNHTSSNSGKPGTDETSLATVPGQDKAGKPSINPEELNQNETVEPAEGAQQEMPDVDSLTAESDLTSFFSDTVSDALRKKALRKIFSFGKYNICDGLDDYAEDYTKFEPLGNVLTADLKLKMERDRLKQLAALEESVTPISRDQEGNPIGEKTLEHADEQVKEDDNNNPSITVRNDSLSETSDSNEHATTAAPPDISSTPESESDQATDEIKQSKIT